MEPSRVGRSSLWRVNAVRGTWSRLLESRPGLRKLVRYSAASAAGLVSSQVALLFGLLVLDLDAVPANLIAVTVGAVPNYLINRAWTFDKRGRHSFTREVIPFWSMALAGLVLSTFSVAWADQRFDGNVLAVSIANIGAFAVLWVAKFFILDRVLFAPLAHAIEDNSPSS